MSGLNIKEMTKREGPLCEGHRMCPGCGAPTAVRQAFMGIDDPIVVVGATGCMEVSSTVYPYSAWRVPFMHVAFENAGAAISGIESAHKALRGRGMFRENIKFVAFGGDGGTYDIGLQALSGALERGHDITYICYNNQGYMNTGAQRSGATPKSASATTSPAGLKLPGKLQRPKNLTEIAEAHDIPYVAQTTLHNPMDVITKVKRAVETKGPAFVNILVPCPLFWKIDPADQAQVCKLAVDSRFWPVYEVADGEYKLSYEPKKHVPVEDFLKSQGRYAHLFKRDAVRTDLIESAQRDVDAQWEKLKMRIQSSQR
ncbi:MAG: pyruvate ferredoxin oxidoreductase [Synergistaceae bacterium]|jgi:pyruvate ferredoxin oxidoreductase beta subunit|nr:pyruvate ferredoxin oxidoreductase [Synergistaceae bacterium]